jgi:4,5-DOPA dioxygenase extradiol
MAQLMPALFVGHGNPMNIIGNNKWTHGWTDLDDGMFRPKAILILGSGNLVHNIGAYD